MAFGMTAQQMKDRFDQIMQELTSPQTQGLQRPRWGHEQEAWVHLHEENQQLMRDQLKAAGVNLP